MSARIKRLWQPGNPQLRVFLPDFWVRIVEPSKKGPGRLPKNCVKFEVDKRFAVFKINFLRCLNIAFLLHCRFEFFEAKTHHKGCVVS